MRNIILVFCLSLGISIQLLAQVKPINEVFEPKGTFDPQVYGKVAVIQWNEARPTPVNVTVAQAEAFKAGVRKQLETLIREAASKGAKWVLTPEFSIVGYPDVPELPPEEDEFQNPEQIKPYVEPIPGPSTRYFSKIAKELGIYLHIGFAEVDKQTDEYFNVIVALGPDGSILTKFRKINLFGGEYDFLSPGTDPVIYKNAFGRVGMLICADVYSGNPMNSYKAKVDVLALSASWTVHGGWSSFVQGAKSLGVPLLASNQTYFPDSGVVNADGSTQSHIRQSSGIAYGYLKYKK